MTWNSSLSFFNDHHQNDNDDDDDDDDADDDDDSAWNEFCVYVSQFVVFVVVLVFIVCR